jgi:hypothetical protein
MPTALAPGIASHNSERSPHAPITHQPAFLVEGSARDPSPSVSALRNARTATVTLEPSISSAAATGCSQPAAASANQDRILDQTGAFHFLSLSRHHPGFPKTSQIRASRNSCANIRDTRHFLPKPLHWMARGRK